jgi:hypothetical protein
VIAKDCETTGEYPKATVKDLKQVVLSNYQNSSEDNMMPKYKTYLEGHPLTHSQI